MKNLFALAAAMFVCTTLAAQPNVGEDVNYYGVDFSKTKTFGAAENGSQFKDAFGRINLLVISEWPKYDPGKFLHKNVAVRDIAPTTAVNNQIDPSGIATSASGYRLSEGDIADMVRGYMLKEREGTGLVIIGELFEKPTVLGGFYVVYFDVASREVLSFRQIIGKAGGFGLRNYWAGALLNALKNEE